MEKRVKKPKRTKSDLMTKNKLKRIYNEWLTEIDKQKLWTVLLPHVEGQKKDVRIKKIVKRVMKEYFQHIPSKFMRHELVNFRISMFRQIKMADHTKVDWRNERLAIDDFILFLRGY